jgi:GDP/UDP-N,N'-diacetylbacillosamine 2-epimerase (hydrolysing)
MKQKISLVTGSRAEYGILKPLIEKLSKNSNFSFYLIVAGMHMSKKHGNTINEIINDGFKISYTVNMIPKSNTNFDMATSLGEGILQFSKIFKKFKPDINIVLGDRDEALAASLVASHLNIVNAHIHGGDKSQAGIDEYNRHAITKLSNIHFAATKNSKKRIIKMGENPMFVFFTGSPSIDGIVEGNISDKKTVSQKYGINLQNQYLVLLQHSVTTQTKFSEKQIIETLKAISKLKIPTIAIMPNSDAGHKEIFRLIKEYSKKFSFIKYYTSIPRSDFLCLLQNCSSLIGNSSAGIIESSYLGIPVVNIGIRQKNRDHGPNVIDIPNHSSLLIQNGIRNSISKRHKPHSFVYGKGNSSSTIVSILEKLKIDSKLINKQIQY